MKKKYTFGGIEYGYSIQFRKWLFRASKFCLVVSVKGGKETAHKIAHLMHGGLIRTNQHGIDNLARSNINSLLSRQRV